MIEVRFHGRGGQGAVVASRLLAEAAFIEGMDVQAFPFFGVERRGAPVTAFTKIDDRPIRVKSMIYEPDFVIVLEQSLVDFVDVLEGLKPEGRVLINTTRSPEEMSAKLKRPVDVVDATQIAIDHGLGSREAPIVNTALLGAFARSSGIVSLDAVTEAIRNNVPRKKEENVAAARDAYEKVRMQEV